MPAPRMNKPVSGYDFWAETLYPYLMRVMSGEVAEQGLKRVGDAVRAGLKGDWSQDPFSDFFPGAAVGSVGKKTLADIAERLKRAGNQGFDTALPLYHGTFETGPIKQFSPGTDLGVHVGVDPAHANNRLRQKAQAKANDWNLETGGNSSADQWMSGANVYKLFGKKPRKTIELEDSSWDNPAYVLDMILEGHDSGNFKLPKKMLEKLEDMYYGMENMPNDATSADYAKILEGIRQTFLDNGYDVIKYKNIVEGASDPGKYTNVKDFEYNTISPYSYIFLNPDDLKSAFAQFDPKRRHIKDILASSVLAAPLLGVMAGGDDAN